MLRLRLKPGREKSLLRRHPWIFSGSIAAAEGSPGPGETVEVYDSAGHWLARAAYSPESSIRARVWTWDEQEAIDEAYFRRRVAASIGRRSEWIQDPLTNAYREIYAESDGLPGLIVDRYGTVRVVQILSAGPERWRATILEAIAENGVCEAIFERSDVEVRNLEGLPPRAGLAWGREINSHVEILEGGSRYFVDVVRGQKTGFYLDQRVNRQVFRDYVARRDVLDGFSYTGGFTVPAIRGGAASVTAIDESEAAHDLARRNVEANGLSVDRGDWVVGDVFRELRRLRDLGATFDVIVLDPPKFAPTAAQVQAASRGYKDVNLLAFKLLRPGGTLFTFSCSGAVGVELFQKIVAGAALDAGVTARIRRWLSQGPDHPVALNFPEGNYLKGLICQVD